jgi:hypothetical protein
VEPIARLQAAIDHSSMEVPPCQPNISISTIERPTEQSAARRVSSPATSAAPAISAAALNRITAG